MLTLGTYPRSERNTAGLKQRESGEFRVGVDIGGTFTDVILISSSGKVWPVKVLSTPDDYSRAVLDGLERIVRERGIGPGEIAEIVHGTTIATNAILEQRGARTALITTAGFRDVLELRRVRVPRLYDVQWVKPAPLVPRYLRFEAHERVDAQGEVLVTLDEEGVRGIVDALRLETVESVAICLINAYLNPLHERRIAEMVHELLPNVSISVSTAISREMMEFERTSTTVVDAYVKPVVDRYLAALERRLHDRGFNAPLFVMQSNGAIMSLDAARESPCLLIESGPAAGAVAGQALAQRTQTAQLITFDMGGTTAKAAVVEAGRLALTGEYEVGAGITVGTRLMKGDGYLLRIPAVDLAEVGAGGGSIARVDAGGRLQVGPESAGSSPGPACYGLGGTEPTITDANVVLGFISPESFVGRSVQIDSARAEQAMEYLGTKLGLNAIETASAVHTIANARMSRAIRSVTTERGLDPRDFALLAFGGSGPIHAASLAAELGIRRIVIPPYAGLFSALGLSLANAGHVVVHTFRRNLDELAAFELLSVISSMQLTLRRRLESLNFPAGDLVFESTADMRYVGQSFSLAVDLHEALAGGERTVEMARNAFTQHHQTVYGHHSTSDPVEIVNLRLRARVGREVSWPVATAAGSSVLAAEAVSRRLFFPGCDGPVDTPVIGRGSLQSPRNGPLSIEEPDTTIIVPPGWRASVDSIGNVWIERT